MIWVLSFQLFVSFFKFKPEILEWVAKATLTEDLNPGV